MPLFLHYPFLVPVMAWLIPQFIKVVISFIQGREDVYSLLEPGGMPSSHASMGAATVYTVAIFSGISSPTFALALAFASVISYDAMGIRAASGKQASAINKLTKLIYHKPLIEQLEEKLGHKPQEVLVGILTGIALSWIMLGFKL